MKIQRVFVSVLFGIGFVVIMMMALTAVTQPASAHVNATQEITILVDDFVPQPYPGNSVHYYNRMSGDRGGLNDTELDYGQGQVTATVSITGNSWGGMWISLNHPNTETIPINFSAIFPPQIQAPFQSRITGLTFNILDSTAGKKIRLELKDVANPNWSQTFTLDGGAQTIQVPLPSMTDTMNLNWVIDPAIPGDFVVVDSIYLSATMPVTETAEQAFLWSYGMLLNNWTPETGLIRDQSRFPSGDFEAIQSTGSLAAATAVAEQLGYVSHADAIQIVSKISDTLLLELPKSHGTYGLWPHWVEITPTNTITILPYTEWSSVDTSIAAIGLLLAQQALDLDTNGVETFLTEIDWNDLVTTTGILHGYNYSGTLIPYAWDTFGGESWLLGLAYAAAEGKVPPLAYPLPPTANGSGFIDELAWLFVPPPDCPDVWGANWRVYRSEATEKQISFFKTHYPDYQMSQLNLFGLSSGETPDPSVVPENEIYQEFRVGGQFAEPKAIITYPINGVIVTASVAAPHYSAMIASIRPDEAIVVWKWLIDEGLFTPLNNVETFMFVEEPPAYVDGPIWNSLKGSWNLALQTLGWGRYLAQAEDKTPILWQSAQENEFLAKGYDLLTDDCYVYLPTILKSYPPETAQLSDFD